MSSNLAQDSLALAQLAELSHRLQTQTEVVERLVSGITNHVLFAGTVTLNSAGFYTFEFGATVGAIEVHNTSATDTLVVSPGSANVQPVQGVGVHYVQPGTWRACNIGQRVVTVWGTAAQLVGVQALTVGGLIGGGAL